MGKRKRKSKAFGMTEATARRCKKTWGGYAGLGTLAGGVLGFGLGKSQGKGTKDSLLQGLGVGLATAVIVYSYGRVTKCARI